MPQQQLTIQQAIDMAVQFYQAGRLPEAESVCRQIVAAQPNHAEALHLLGILTQKAGRSEAAIEFICNAIRANPRDPEFHYNLGQILAGMSPPRLLEAAAAFRQATALRPQFVDAHYALGTTLNRLGKSVAHQAVQAFENAIAAQADFWPARLDLANALQAVGRIDDAIQVLRQTLVLKPDYVSAHFNLANTLLAAERTEEALEPVRKAIALKPDFFEAYINLAHTLRKLGRLDESVAQLRKAIELRPQSHEAWHHLGLSLAAQEHTGQLDQAIAAFEKALEYKPGVSEVQNNLGIAVVRKGNIERAAPIFEQVLAAEPDNAFARYNLAQIRLLQGDFARGWPLYEWRWQVGDLAKVRQEFPQPKWDGSDLRGKRIFVYAEQGFGDAIHFVRYLPLLKERGAESVIVQIRPEQARLVRAMPGVSHVVTEGDPMPQFDVHSPLLSLPLAFGTKLETIPTNVPYLQAEPELSEKWRQRIVELKDGKSLNVGLSWAGRSEHSFDRFRSITLAALAPLAQASAARFFSLQIGQAADQANNTPPGMEFIDWTNDLKDFSDSAALIDNLDLVITVDTAIAHLAGAMGKPVWVLIPFAPDWRWMLDRSDSPWYPTMKLFRQPKAGDWQTPIGQIAEALETFENTST